MTAPHAPSEPLTAADTAARIREGDLTARDAIDHALARARANAHLNALTETLEDTARAAADTIDQARANNNPLPPLAGVPIVIKDNICTTMGHTTAASRILEGYRSPFNATAITRLINAGAIPIAKSNMDEFGMGSSGENSSLGPTLNPHDHTRTPGGSSSGSAAAVAAAIAPLALGSDTGGSIRQPAAHTGLVGLKPTYARVSRLGLIAFASSLDQIAPIARTPRDCALLFDAIAAHDPHDSTSANQPPPTTAHTIDELPQGLRIAITPECASPANHPEINANLQRTIRALEDLGVTLIHDAKLPHAHFGISAYYLIATAEASSNLARYDAIRYGKPAELTPTTTLTDHYERTRTQHLGPEVRRRILLGTYALSAGYYDAYYLRALKTRRLIKHDFDAVFNTGAHAILTPTTSAPAFRLTEKSEDPLALYLEDTYTVPASLAGLPAISFPTGHATIDNKQLPTAAQLIAPPFNEALLLQLAHALSGAGVSPTIGAE